MTTNKELLAIAKKQIGNTGEKYRKYVGKSGNWCDMFVFWLFDANGCGSLLKWTGIQKTYCPASLEWCRKHLAQIPPYLAMAMDIVYMDWDKNKVPNHIGVAEKKDSTAAIKTIEGNTSGGKVDDKTRNTDYTMAIFRPHFKPEKLTLGVIEVDGSFGYNSIANLQRALGGLTVDGVLGKKTVCRLQEYLALKQDGAWGTKTSKAVQSKLCGFKGKDVDGQFGEKSVRALQKWINKTNAHEDVVVPEPEPEPVEPVEPAKPTRAEKIVAKMLEYAYAYGTPKKKWAYKTGKPKLAYKEALKKYMKKSAKISQSDCGYFVSTIIRAAGISKTFLALAGRKEPFPKVPSTMKIVHKGKIPNGLLKKGDVIRYKKTGGGQHTLIYFGDGKIAEAGRKHYFPAIKKDTKKYNKKNVKKSTIQVLRAKD